jgi:GNAT superfamily N-acetyltransferase
MTSVPGPLRRETALALAAQFASEEAIHRSLVGDIADEMIDALASERILTVHRGDASAVLVVDERARAWYLGATGSEGSLDDGMLRALRDAARGAGAERLYSGGPARWYLRSGVADERARGAWERAGGIVASDHRDVRVTLSSREDSPARGEDASGSIAVVAVTARDALDRLCEWIARDFSEDWARETRRAHARGTVFVGVNPATNEVVGFVGHSGHAAARGTFGPLGVRADARGRGLGARLADRALRDLAKRGFGSVLIPWVEPEILAVYRSVAPSMTVERRVLYRCALG